MIYCAWRHFQQYFSHIMVTMNRHHHHHPIECITCSRHDLAEQWLIWCWTTITHCWKHSLAIISSFIVFYQFYFDLFDHKNLISKDVVLVIMLISHYDRSRGTNPLQIKSHYKFGMCCLSANHITLRIWFWFDLWCLTPLSTIFQLYHGDQF